MKILIGQLGSNGDCLHATILARQIKNDFENAKLTWAISESCQNIIKNNPYIDDIWIIPDSYGFHQEEGWINFENEANEMKNNGYFDEIYLSQICPSNFHRFDGTVRVSVLRAYTGKYTVPIEPIIYLDNLEIDNVNDFIEKNKIYKFKNRIIFECASRSGQSYVTPDYALEFSKKLLEIYPDTVIILSSNFKIESNNPNIVDGSELTIRETAYLTNFATLFIGSVSGISVAALSNVAKKIPMIQLLNKNQSVYASISKELEYWNLSNDHIIELVAADVNKLVGVVECINDMGFNSARDLFNEDISIRYNLYIDAINYRLNSKGLYDKSIESLYYTVGRFGWHPQLVDYYQNILFKHYDGYNNPFYEYLNESLEDYLKNGKLGIIENLHLLSQDNVLDNSYNIELLETLIDFRNKVNEEITIIEKQESEDYLITAIVSVYNSQKYIKGCLDDLIAQTIFDKTEVIIVNANSEQNEEEIINEYLKKYKNIKYIKTDFRENVYQSWNRAIKIAKGKYITNANTDDRHRRDAFELLTKLLEENPEIGIAYADSIITKNSNETIYNTKSTKRFDWPDFNKSIAITTSIFGPHPVWRKTVHEKMGYFNEEFEIASDFDFFTRVAINYGALHLKETLGLFLQRKESLSGKANTEKTINEVNIILNKLRNELGIEGIFPQLKEKISNLDKAVIYFTYAYLLGFGPYFDINEAVKYYEKSLNFLDNEPVTKKELSQLVKHNLGIILVKVNRKQEALNLWQENSDFIDSNKNLEILKNIIQNKEGFSINMLYPSMINAEILKHCFKSISVYCDENKDFIYTTSNIHLKKIFTGTNGINISESELKNIKEHKMRLIDEEFPLKDYLVSAIISCYNSEKFIKGRLDNLISQTYFNKTEIVIVNSGSQENEDTIIKEYLHKFPNIVYYKTSIRETLYKAWNRAISLCSGKYIISSNTDDILRIDAIEIMASLLEIHSEYSLVYSDVLIANEYINEFNIERIKHKYLLPDSNKGIFLATSGFGPSPMWRAELHKKYGYFNEKYTIAGDYEFFTKIAINENVIHLREPLVIFLAREDSLSGKQNLQNNAFQIAEISSYFRNNINLNDLYVGFENYSNDIKTVISVLVDFANLSILSPYGNFEKASLIFQKVLEIAKDTELINDLKLIIKNNLSVFFFCLGEYKLAFEYIEGTLDNQLCKLNYDKMIFYKENKIKVHPNDFEILEIESELLHNARKSYGMKYVNGEFLLVESYRRFWDVYFGLDPLPINTNYYDYDNKFTNQKDYNDLLFYSKKEDIPLIKKENYFKILFTMYGWDEAGGGTKFPRDLAKSLSNFGYEVAVFFATGKHQNNSTPYYLETTIEDGISLFGLYNRKTEFLDLENPLREIEDAKATEKFIEVLNIFQPNLIHYHNFLGLSFKIAEIGFNKGIPSVYTPHNFHIIDPELYLINNDLSIWRNSNFFENSYLSLKNKSLESEYKLRFNYSKEILKKYVNYTLCISKRQKEIFTDFGINSEKLLVYHQIPESLNFIEKKEKTYLSKTLNIGYLGSIIAIKGIHNVILAANELNQEHFKFYFYGDGNPSYISFLKGISKTNNIEFKGNYNYNQLNQIFDEIDILILPSIVEEGAGLVILEGLAAGLPIIASRIGGITDFVIDDYNGKLYQYNSYRNLVEILKNYYLNKEILLEHHKNSKIFNTRQDFLNKINELYLNLINNNHNKINYNFMISLTNDKYQKSNNKNKQNNKEDMNNNENPMNRIKFDNNLEFGFSNNDAKGKLPNPLPNPLLLNLGCGKDIREGFINIDLFSDNDNVVKMDIRRLDLPDNSADLILASDVLEHFSHRETDLVLKEWNRVLKPNGELIIRCPSLYLQAKAYLNKTWNADIASYMIFGGQTNPGDYHCIGFDEESIKRHLTNTGFVVEFFEEIDTPQNNGYINLNMSVRARKLSTTLKVEKNESPLHTLKTDNKSLFDFIHSDNKSDVLYNEKEKLNKKTKYPLNIVWEGSQFVYHSLALINREHCSNLIDTNLFEITIIPYENDAFTPGLNEKYNKLWNYDIRNKLSNESQDSPFLWIRHQWPPKDEIPQGAKWIINQPWEFSVLTKKFVEIFKKADEIWTPSTFSRNSFIKSGLDFNKVQIVPNGINPEIFKPGKSDFHLKTNKKLKLLFVGGTIYRKGIDILLNAYVKSFNKKDDVCLIIKDIGNSSFYNGQTAEETIRKIQENSNAPEIIYIQETLSENEITELYKACNVFISPYRGEGFSLPTLEAMACGLPVVVTKGGATDDFVDDTSGWFIESKEKSIGFHIDGNELTDEGFLLEPDENDLIRILKFIYANPSILYVKGLNASFKARTQWTWKKATLKLISRIDAIYGSEFSKKAESALEDIYDSYMILGLADEDYFNQKYDDAEKLFKLAIESNELDKHTQQFALLRLVLIELINENFFTAEDYFKKAEEVYVNTPDLIYTKIQLLTYEKKWEEVLEVVQEMFNDWEKIKFSVRLGFNLDDLFCDTANALFELDYIEDAIKLYEEALKINNNSVSACIGSAKCFLAVEELDSAKEMLDIALLIEPDNKAAKELRQGID